MIEKLLKTAFNKGFLTGVHRVPGDKESRPFSLFLEINTTVSNFSKVLEKLVTWQNIPVGNYGNNIKTFFLYRNKSITKMPEVGRGLAIPGPSRKGVMTDQTGILIVRLKKSLRTPGVTLFSEQL